MMNFNSINDKFQQLRSKLIQKLQKRSMKTIFESDILVIGLINRAFSLHNGLGMAHQTSNPYSFVVLYRAQMETLATINHIINKPNDVGKFLHGKRKGTENKITNILTLLDECEDKYPKIRGIYEDISEMAHPNSASHFLSTDRDGSAIRLRNNPTMSKKESERTREGLIEISEYVINDLDILVDKLIA